MISSLGERQFSVTKHHLLIIPKRHINDYFGLYQSELNTINELLQRHQLLIKKQGVTVKEFNVDSNNGEDSGQTIFHCHVHLIPKRKNDTENPRGVLDVLSQLNKIINFPNPQRSP